MMSPTQIALENLQVLLPFGWILAAYGIGSIPEAWLIARWVTGQDLRRMGSGNVGVMNTALSVSRWAGLLVFLSEVAKGMLAVAVPRGLMAGGLMTGGLIAGDAILSLSVVAVVVGARWPVWLGFKGGRGNTVGMSAFLLIAYPAPVIALALWVLVRLLLHSSFKATRVTILSLPLILWMVTHSGWFVLAGLAISLIYIGAQQVESDDHTLIKQHWKSIWGFLTTPVRRG